MKLHAFNSMRKKYLEENEKFELRTTFAENESFPVEQQNT